MHTEFIATRVIMKETTRYDDVYLRPYQSNYDGDVANQLMMATEHGSNVSPLALAGVAGSFIQPSAATSHRATIENGFGEKRLSFMIEVRENNNSMMGTGSRFIITGYSDHFGAVYQNGSALLDPNLKLFINNVFVIRDSYQQTSHSNQATVSTMISADHILHRPDEGLHMRAPQPLYMQRPEDVFAKLSYSNDMMTQHFRNAEVDDGRNSLIQLSSSKRSHEVPSRWLSDSIRAYRNAEAESTTYGDDHLDATSTWDNSRATVRNSISSNNRLMGALQIRTNLPDLGYVTYRELCSIIPNLDAENQVLFSDRNTIAREYQPGQGDTWNQATYEAIAASIVKQSVPAIMSDCLITSIVFQATNDTFGGEPVVSISSVMSFTTGIDMTRYVEHFIERLKCEILSMISQNGARVFNLECQMNMLYDSHITVSIDNQPPVYLAAPSFCDGLYAPILTADQQGTSNLAHDVETMLLNLGGDLSRMASRGYEPNQQPSQPTPISDPFAMLDTNV